MDILLVDDNADDRALARRTLARALPEARFVEAGDRAALQAALVGPGPDVAVTDYALGWADGLQVFHLIRSAYPDCGVVMFTGSLGEAAAVEVMRAGLDDYVVKDPAHLGRLVSSVTGLLRRVEERRARRRAEARRTALAASAGVGLFTCRPDGTLIEANPALRRMLGIAPAAEVGALNLRRLVELDGHWPESGLPGVVQGLEVAFRRPDGGAGAALLDATPVPEAEGEVEGVLTDVTPLRNALDQRTALLREVYHRVYNNLQVVDSILTLQARRFADPEVQAGFTDVGERLRALSLIQQQLYRGEDFETVAFDAYLDDLARALAGLQRRPEIVPVLQVQPAALPVETAIPLGLIATELLGNAYKHAFPGGRPGRIALSLAVTPPGLEMTVADDGVGAPADLYGGLAADSIGARVVPLLAAQIEARIAVEVAGGTRVVVSVPARPGAAA